MLSTRPNLQDLHLVCYLGVHVCSLPKRPWVHYLRTADRIDATTLVDVPAQTQYRPALLDKESDACAARMPSMVRVVDGRVVRRLMRDQHDGRVRRRPACSTGKKRLQLILRIFGHGPTQARERTAKSHKRDTIDRLIPGMQSNPDLIEILADLGRIAVTWNRNERLASCANGLDYSRHVLTAAKGRYIARQRDDIRGREVSPHATQRPHVAVRVGNANDYHSSRLSKGIGCPARPIITKMTVRVRFVLHCSMCNAHPVQSKGK